MNWNSFSALFEYPMIGKGMMKDEGKMFSFMMTLCPFLNNIIADYTFITKLIKYVVHIAKKFIGPLP